MAGPAKKESHLRSILKGITWRLIATATTIGVAYLITGETDIAIKIGAIEFVCETAGLLRTRESMAEPSTRYN